MDFSKFRSSGDLSDIKVTVDSHEYNLHKFPLYARSDYFCELARSKPGSDVGEPVKIELKDFPGGNDIFGQVADFCYNMSVNLTKSNIVAMRCAAEYLKMFGPGNLKDVATKFLMDTLTSAKLNRSTAVIVSLLLHCNDIGEVAKDAGIVDLCLEALVECWMKPGGKPAVLGNGSVFTKVKPLTQHQEGGSAFTRVQTTSNQPTSDSVDEISISSLMSLRVDWFANLLTKARIKGVNYAELGNLAVRYISSTLDKNRDNKALITGEQATASLNGKETSDTASNGEKDVDTHTTSQGSSRATSPVANVEEDEKPVVAEDPVTSVDVGAILDKIVLVLPEQSFSVPSVTMEWMTKSGPVIDMPVPSSYNDVTEDKNLRDFVGWAWYGRGFYVSSDWASNRRVNLRIDSAHYYSVVWVNGNEVMRHDGGHLPFEAEVMNFLNYNGHNYITVAVNNTLTPTTLPPGTIQYETDTSKYPSGYFVQNLQMDFFNYAGIHRHVRLYTTPMVYIDDINILTDYADEKGHVTYEVIVGGGTAKYAQINLIDADGSVVANSTKLSDTLVVPFPRLWYPYGMNMSVGNMYTLQLNVSGDMYRQEFGIRTVKVTDNQILINDKPFYCLGVAKHEDSDLRGKGLDYPLFTKDFNMLRWLGVNCIRTSHYPYAEEILQFADRQGVAVIDESPGVGIQHEDNFGNVSLKHHIEVMGEMIRRDKNKPSVIMWSIANEPATNLDVSVPYFRDVLNYTKTTDPAHRPVTFVSDRTFESEKVVQYVDVICINRYYGWYSDMGHLEVIQRQLAREFAGFRNLYQKPIIVTEYGADTVSGMHREPSFVFTEEYQVDFLETYHKEFDVARQEFLVGEMVWNFADFMTVQGVTRVVGNKKGLLTRQRQPKPAAFVIRDRYNAIASGLNTTCGCRSSKASKYSLPHTYPQIP